MTNIEYSQTRYNELGNNEQSVITHEYFGPKCPFTTQIDPVITNPNYNERICLAGPKLFVITEFHCTLLQYTSFDLTWKKILKYRFIVTLVQPFLVSHEPLKQIMFSRFFDVILS